MLRLGRILLREILIKSLVLSKHANGAGQPAHAQMVNGQASLAAMLKKAYSDDGYHQAIHNQLREVEALV